MGNVNWSRAYCNNVTDIMEYRTISLTLISFEFLDYKILKLALMAQPELITNIKAFVYPGTGVPLPGCGMRCGSCETRDESISPPPWGGASCQTGRNRLGVRTGAYY